MTMEQVRKTQNAPPFRPFVINLADGQKFPVNHPEFVWVAPGGRTIFVADAEGAIDIIDLLLTSLKVKGTAKETSKGQKD